MTMKAAAIRPQTKRGVAVAGALAYTHGFHRPDDLRSNSVYCHRMGDFLSGFAKCSQAGPLVKSVSRAESATFSHPFPPHPRNPPQLLCIRSSRRLQVIGL